MTPENIIFAIDNPTDRRCGMFEKAFALSDTSGSLVPCEGSWEGITERSYLCTRADFEKAVKALGWVDQQECILAVTSCNKMYAQE